MSLADELRRLRRVRRLSLRAVEGITGISNAYLSQLENRHVLNPSPHLLRKLATAYDVPYETLLAAAGYVDIATKYSFSPTVSALLSGVRLTDDQESELLSFVRTLIAKPRPIE
ncbi:MAG: helix-turn-helix domain-containing protein [Thermoanaerobaculia bacterium]